MGKFFKFSDRFVTVTFFEEDPIRLTMQIGDEQDRKIISASELIAEGSKTQNLEKRAKCFAAALDEVIGRENLVKLLERSPEKDSFAMLEIWHYLIDAYGAQKVKNLSASAR